MQIVCIYGWSFQQKSDSVLTPQQELESADQIPLSRLRALLRDFTDLLGQQMYFWGRDVIYPEGNLLCEYGFERRKSKGLVGTNCYRLPLNDGGLIELHGACAGHYRSARSQDQSLLYIRKRRRCFLYSENDPPAPELYRAGSLSNGPALEVYFSSLRFLDWWLAYEKWIAQQTSSEWREKCFEAFASLPASRPSLPPREAILWLSQFRSNPGKISRVRDRLRPPSSRVQIGSSPSVFPLTSSRPRFQ